MTPENSSSECGCTSVSAAGPPETQVRIRRQRLVATDDGVKFGQCAPGHRSRPARYDNRSTACRQCSVSSHRPRRRSSHSRVRDEADYRPPGQELANAIPSSAFLLVTSNVGPALTGERRAVLVQTENVPTVRPGATPVNPDPPSRFRS
jgi:hypothetical protein